LTQEQAAQVLGLCVRSFRRYIDRYEEAGLEGLMDRRISEVSSRKAPVDEVLRMEALYRERYDGWSVKHFFERYQDEHKGQRSYSSVKSRPDWPQTQTAWQTTPATPQGPAERHDDPSGRRECRARPGT